MNCISFLFAQSTEVKHGATYGYHRDSDLDSNQNNCLTIADGVITKADILGNSLCTYKVIYDKELLRKYKVKCVYLITTPYSDIEEYIFNKVKNNIRRGVKVPIIINGKYFNLNNGDYFLNINSYNTSISAINKKKIKKIKYISATEAQRKYDIKIVFGAVEVEF